MSFPDFCITISPIVLVLLLMHWDERKRQKRHDKAFQTLIDHIGLQKYGGTVTGRFSGTKLNEANSPKGKATNFVEIDFSKLEELIVVQIVKDRQKIK